MNQRLFLKSPDNLAKTRVEENKRENLNQSPKFFIWLLLGIMLIAIAYMFKVPEKDFVEYIDGEPRIAPWRLEKMYKEWHDIDNAEQYALLAEEDGEYPCYTCWGMPTIFLKEGQVWKYGYTRLNERKRYGNWHKDNRLGYFIQFRGTLAECAKEEKKKIYYYPVLPENLVREKPLNRPPGNKKD